MNKEQEVPDCVSPIYKIVWDILIEECVIGLNNKDIVRHKIIIKLKEKQFKDDYHSFVAGEIFICLLDNPLFDVAVTMRRASMKINN